MRSIACSYTGVSVACVFIVRASAGSKKHYSKA